MKTPGFLYEVNEVIVFNRELKPLNPNGFSTVYLWKKYDKALEKWTEACIPVENVFQCGKHEFRIRLTERFISPCIKDAQPCLAELGEKVKIIKLT